MKTRAKQAKWHMVTDAGDGRGFATLYCGPIRNAAHYVTEQRGPFEKLPKRARCEACDQKLAGHKAHLLAEVAEIERRSPPAVVAR